MSASSRPRRRATLALLTAGVLAATASPVWAAGDDRLLLVEQSVWRAEVRQADGAQARELYAGAPDTSDLARGGSWLPDASGVVVLDQPIDGGSRSGTPRVVLVARDGSSRRTLATDGITGLPVAGPDGLQVAFPADDRVELVRTDGAGRHRLATVSEGFGVGAVEWSPNGLWLALLVVSDTDGTTSLWRLASDGTDVTRISPSGEALAGYGVAWSPDSASIAYAVETADGPQITVDEPSGRRTLTTGSDPSWSPDGSALAVADGDELRVVDAEDGAELASWQAGDSCVVTSPSWSPDSATVAFSRAYTGAGCTTGDAMLLDVVSGTADELAGARTAKYGYALAFSPLPTTLPALRTTEQACPEGEVPEDGFADTEGSVFESDVDCVTWWELARGNGSGYAPGAPVTRAQTALLLARLLRQADVALDTSDRGFTDVAGLSAEARDAVNAVANAEVARGTSATTFSPGAAVTRGQLASFLVRLQGVLDVPLPGAVHCFADTWSSVHREAAERLCAAGIARGDGAGGFAPGTPVTRGQVAGLLARALDLGVDAERLTPPSA